MHKSLERGVGVETLRDDLRALGVDVLRFDGDAVEDAANLRLVTGATGLSLGDRAGQVLCRQLDLPAVTADRTWKRLDLPDPVAVIVIR